MLFDLSGCRKERNAVFDRLKTSLNEILGARDAERFGVLSKMEGLADPPADSYRYESEVVFTDPDRPNPEDPVAASEKAFRESDLNPRLRYLGFDIDWSRLKPANKSPR